MDDFFAPPPFDAQAALLKLKRRLREAGLSERGACFERRGLAWASAQVEDGALLLGAVKVPGRSPEWVHTRVGDHARLRAWTDALVRRLREAKDPDD